MGSCVCITLSIEHFTDGEVSWIYEIVLGKAMALDIGMEDRCITIVKTHGPGVGSDPWGIKS